MIWTAEGSRRSRTSSHGLALRCDGTAGTEDDDGHADSQRPSKNLKIPRRRRMNRISFDDTANPRGRARRSTSSNPWHVLAS